MTVVCLPITAHALDDSLRQCAFHPAAELSDDDEDRIFDGKVPSYPSIGQGAAGGLGARGYKTLRARFGPVKTQGYRPLCAVFAAIALLEFCTGDIFSEQCFASEKGGEEAGFIHESAEEIVNGHSLAMQSDCPYLKTSDQRFVIPRDKPMYRFNPVGSLVVHGIGRDDGVDPVRYVIDRLNEGNPVATNVWLVGDWWDKKSYHPKRLASGAKRTVTVGTVMEGNRRTIEISDQPRFYPFAALYSSGQVAALKLWKTHHSKDPDEGQTWEQYLNRVMPVDESRSPRRADDCWEEQATRKRHCHTHAIVFTGFDLQGESLEFRNSWGPKWRNEGYGYMSFQYLRKFYQSKKSGNAFVTFSNGKFPCQNPF